MPVILNNEYCIQNIYYIVAVAWNPWYNIGSVPGFALLTVQNKDMGMQSGWLSHPPSRVSRQCPVCIM